MADEPQVTLRDYFAAHAMSAIIGHPDTNHISDMDAGEVKGVAEEAYQIADAMLRSRGGP